MKITRKSLYTGNENTMELPITELQLHDWLNGEETAFALFPQLTSEQMEFLLVGITAEERKLIRADLIADGEIIEEVSDEEVLAAIENSHM